MYTFKKGLLEYHISSDINETLTVKLAISACYVQLSRHTQFDTRQPACCHGRGGEELLAFPTSLQFFNVKKIIFYFCVNIYSHLRTGKFGQLEILCFKCCCTLLFVCLSIDLPLVPRKLFTARTQLRNFKCSNIVLITVGFLQPKMKILQQNSYTV